jgi:hypothetical protein
MKDISDDIDLDYRGVYYRVVIVVDAVDLPKLNHQVHGPRL